MHSKKLKRLGQDDYSNVRLLPCRCCSVLLRTDRLLTRWRGPLAFVPLAGHCRTMAVLGIEREQNLFFASESVLTAEIWRREETGEGELERRRSEKVIWNFSRRVWPGNVLLG